MRNEESVAVGAVRSSLNVGSVHFPTEIGVFSRRCE
jgi:hypothetical protein